jgi:hypothetical protein
MESVMATTSWTDKSYGFYFPFEEKSWLWTNTPYLVFLLVNCLYLPIFISCGVVILGALAILAVGLAIGGIGYLIYRFPLRTLWISLAYKDGEAKSRIKKLWWLDTPTDIQPTTNSVDTTHPMCSDGETNIGELHNW